MRQMIHCNSYPHAWTLSATTPQFSPAPSYRFLFTLSRCAHTLENIQQSKTTKLRLLSPFSCDGLRSLHVQFTADHAKSDPAGKEQEAKLHVHCTA
jgi:hypothetical protein